MSDDDTELKQTDQGKNADEDDSSVRFKGTIKEAFTSLDRPARLSDLSEIYQSLVSIVDCIQPILGTINAMPLTEAQRKTFKEAQAPLRDLIKTIGDGFIDLASPKKSEDENEN